MGTSAIAPIASIDFNSANATSAEKSVFSSLFNQLQQAVSAGNLNNTSALLGAVEEISPSSLSGNNPLGAFLTNLTTALKDNSVTAAQSALATYRTAVASSSSTSPASTPTANPGAVAAQIVASIVQTENQALLAAVNASLAAPSQSASSQNAPSSNGSVSSLINILNAAYPVNGSAGAATPTTSPYDTLLSSIQASLAASHGTITPAIASLQAAGNFVNTSA
jgi:hypothetical protein